MNYTKPGVAVLGEAVRVIELLAAKPVAPIAETSRKQANPAYDFDE